MHRKIRSNKRAHNVHWNNFVVHVIKRTEENDHKNSFFITIYIYSRGDATTYKIKINQMKRHHHQRCTSTSGSSKSVSTRVYVSRQNFSRRLSNDFKLNKNNNALKGRTNASSTRLNMFCRFFFFFSFK